MWPWTFFGGATIASVGVNDLALFAAGAVVSNALAYGPDIEHQNSTATHRTIAGHYVSRLVRKIAQGHRMGTHSIAATLAVGVVIALVAFAVGQGAGVGDMAWSLQLAWTMGLAASVGWGAHILGDLLNPQGCALFWPFWKRRVHLMEIPCSPPKPERMKVGEFLFNAFLIATQLYFILTFLSTESQWSQIMHL